MPCKPLETDQHAFMGQFTEQVEYWVSEFAVSTEGELAVRDFGERAAGVLVRFMDTACDKTPPNLIDEPEVRSGVQALAGLDLSSDERAGVPALIEIFFGVCERAGRLSGGEQLGAYAHVTATAHLLKKKQIKRTIKVGPNEPCPCGSGKKYKKCCQNRA